MLQQDDDKKNRIQNYISMLKSDGFMVRRRVAKERRGGLVGEDIIDNVVEVKLARCVIAQSDVRAMFQQLFHVVDITCGSTLCRWLLPKPDAQTCHTTTAASQTQHY